MRLLILIFTAALGAPAGAASDGDPVAFVTVIYEGYEADAPDINDVYCGSRPCSKTAETPEGEVGRIDWDVFIDGQDWRLSDLKITLVSQEADHAQVRATFKNFEHPSNMLFDLVLEDGHWRVDDIAKTVKPRWTLSKILTDAPDAFPDEQADDGDPD
ncbi:MAG: hypothetical protein R3D30_07830 [Hyphomicrobiales bacterium]